MARWSVVAALLGHRTVARSAAVVVAARRGRPRLSAAYSALPKQHQRQAPKAEQKSAHAHPHVPAVSVGGESVMLGEQDEKRDPPDAGGDNDRRELVRL